MPTVLVVHHSPTASVATLTDAVVAGASDDTIEGVTVVVRPALEADAEDVLTADALVLGTPANFGYMSGALKHFFDSVFLRVGGALADDGAASAAGGGRTPYGLYVHGRYDTTGAVRSVESIAGALPWRAAAPVLEVLGEVGEADRESAYELGARLAALVMP
ncbi:flavodoxin family protein [Nocardioides hwasunensis]|uniref:Flavodoxin family protein n=1 Tax=Nocardioides hwasunensis TaxID=397258 RepID=A0ABR8MJC1_9ACTN|nr:NAD(P)H-dependent oxidoreductase [Nocardioides hwasunensis]MBD3916149.1 flavodoxin family protein [Nocardioides hwasunensis]